MSKKEDKNGGEQNTVEHTAPQALPPVTNTATNVTASTTENQKARTRSIEYIIVALSGMAPEAAKRLAGKMTEKEKSELKSAYESRSQPRAMLSKIRDRITDDAAKEKAE